LFAGIPVGNYPRARAWYERLLGSGPSFVPNGTEAVWELAEHRWICIEVRPDHAGHSMHTVFVDDLVPSSGRSPTGVSNPPSGNGLRKVMYRDPDGNETGFGGAPLTS
jgi:hypothetical protein